MQVALTVSDFLNRAALVYGHRVAVEDEPDVAGSLGTQTYAEMEARARGLALALDDLGDIVQPYASHALDLQTTVALGKRLGHKMPEEVRIYAIKIKENTVFREGLTPPVEEVVSRLAQRLIGEIDQE